MTIWERIKTAGQMVGMFLFALVIIAVATWEWQWLTPQYW